MRAAKRRKVADAGDGEDDRCDDAEQRIASLDARGKDGDAENGPRHRRHVKDRADDGAGAARFENAAGMVGIERGETLALADQRMPIAVAMPRMAAPAAKAIVILPSGDLPMFLRRGHGPRLGIRGFGGRRGPCRSPVQQTARSNNCRFSDRRDCDIIADGPEHQTIALPPTLIDGNGYPTNIPVVWARPLTRQEERDRP